MKEKESKRQVWQFEQEENALHTNSLVQFKKVLKYQKYKTCVVSNFRCKLSQNIYFLPTNWLCSDLLKIASQVPNGNILERKRKGNVTLNCFCLIGGQK